MPAIDRIRRLDGPTVDLRHGTTAPLPTSHPVATGAPGLRQSMT